MKRVTSYVVKVASRCNLNCSYCYMYNLGDKTYMNQPKFMSLETVTALAERLDAYTRAAGIKIIQVVFHGGEPLLLDREYYKQCLEIFKEKAPELEISFSMQTNGVSLDEEWYEWLRNNKILVGISLDGPEAYHDAYRKFHNGHGSYREVSEAVKLGARYDMVGVLSVMNINIPAQEYYDEIKKLGINNLNLLFPDGHYDKLPDAFDKTRMGDDYYTPFGDWLVELFTIWKKDRNRPLIKMFDNLVLIMIGEDSIGNQAFGLTNNGVAVIETNGSIEVVDSLRACYEGITRNNINVHTNRIEDILETPLFEVYYHSHRMVAEKCLNCPVYDFCGGGFLGNRYSHKDGFDNPTIYCRDIIRLVTHIQNDFISQLPAQTVDTLELQKVSYEDIINELQQPAQVNIEADLQQKLNSFKQPDPVCS